MGNAPDYDINAFEPVTVAQLRAELVAYPDDALVEVVVPVGTDGSRVLRVVRVGSAPGTTPDSVLGYSMAIVTEPAPSLEQ